LHQIIKVESRLAEEAVAPLPFQLQQSPLDRADAGCGDIAVLGFELRRVVADMLEHGAQILEVEQEHAVIVGYFENQIEHAALSVVEIEQA